MTTAVADLPRLRPEPHPILPLGPFRMNGNGIERFRTEGPKVKRFIEENCVLTNGQWIGRPFELLGWEEQLILDLFELAWCDLHEQYCRRYRTALIGVGKKNGKSELVAALALYFLLGAGESAPLVPCAAAGDDQADIVFNAAKTMAEMSPTLRDVVAVYDKEILVPESPNACLRRVPASGGRLDGKNIYVSICDELHEWMPGNQEKTHGMMRGGSAARAHPMNINITTAGFDEDTICYRLYDYGRKLEAGAVIDPTFFFRWWQAPEGCDYRDPAMLPLANPSYGVTTQPAFYADEVSKRRESEFRRYYLNQWVAVESTWLPQGTWKSCENKRRGLSATKPTFVGWDASTKYDSTAIVMGQWFGRKLRIRAMFWERPVGPDGTPVDDWEIPGGEVSDFIRDHWRHKRVAAVAFDPAFITWLAQDLAAEGVPMVEWPQTDSRMIPATQAAYELIVEGRLQHDGDPILARHIAAAVSVATRRGGYRLTKAKAERKHIDGAVALVMMIGMAMRHQGDAESRYEREGEGLFAL